MRALTIKQPWADLIMAGGKDVENRTWPVPSTLPQWGTCPGHGRVILDYPPDGHIAEDGEERDIVPDHHPACLGDCHRHGCPVPVEVQRDPRYPCGPIEPDGPFPFRLWVHAAKTIDGSNDRGQWHEWGNVRPAEDPRTGVLLGSVTVTGCHHADECTHEYSTDFTRWAEWRRCSRWAEPRCWHWTLTDPEPLVEPIPMRGALGLWRLPEAVAA